MRRQLLLLLPALAACLPGCGEDPAPPPRPPVQLALAAPRDSATTREATVQVSGNVLPDTARVIVLGQRVAVDGGGFSPTVDLREGPNVIDVGASAPGRRAVWHALRVTRRSTIRMPALVGSREDAAKSALGDLGLSVQVSNDDDLIDAFRGGPEIVCATVPDAGAQLNANAEVEVVVSKTC